ncbi:MAG: ribonuclease J [Nitrospirae bacterium]|nr:ribonuclease J [Nitrospirota bacterium]MBF0535759.1 ribonuclease J [Nitrospirota bacterium]MBF0615788.1 ribonuclease J [Nitrospirota bacterium]
MELPTLAAGVSIIPLGGVEEIGLNMTILETDDSLIVIDAGLMFPEEGMHGVDFVIPDYSYILDNKDKLRGIIITHGHEDHTGALPFLLKDLGPDVPVYGTLLTIGLIKDKLKEYNVKDLLFIIIKPRDRITLGDFTVEFIRVAHSIADGVGLAVETPYGTIIHTGDFKFDSSPVDGEFLDISRFAHYGEKGVLLLMSDSTNAERGGFTPSEKVVRAAFEDVFAKAAGRIIIATFASNIHRIQQVVDVAVEFGKKVVLCGRSIVSNVRIAMDLGYLRIPFDTCLKVEEIKNLKPGETVIVTTGSQGEPMSVLTRIARNEHKQIKVKTGDTVIISAKAIPGNGRAVGKIINQLFKIGADVIYEKVADVHVSGHASVEELKLMLNITKPKYFVPIHGEYRHLHRHAYVAKTLGIAVENIFLLSNGNVLEINQQEGVLADGVTAGRVYIEGKNLCDIGDLVLKERRRLAQDGVVIVLISIAKEDGSIVSGPDIITRGFVFESSSKEIMDEARALILEAFATFDDSFVKSVSNISAKVKSILRKFIRNKTEKRPIIMPVIVEV